MKKALENRFGKDNIRELSVGEGEMPLFLIDIDARTKFQVLMTSGLSDYEMPVPEKEIGKEFRELYFCLPNYWEIDETDNPRMNWVFYWIQRLSKYVVEKETWFGNGHTMPCGKEKQPLSDSMKQDHFILLDPIILENELAPLEVDGKTIHFLSIVPIFEAELNYKLAKGTKKFRNKFIRAGNNEKLDDFRVSVIRNRWRIL